MFNQDLLKDMLKIYEIKRKIYNDIFAHHDIMIIDMIIFFFIFFLYIYIYIIYFVFLVLSSFVKVSIFTHLHTHTHTRYIFCFPLMRSLIPPSRSLISYNTLVCCFFSSFLFKIITTKFLILTPCNKSFYIFCWSYIIN